MPEETKNNMRESTLLRLVEATARLDGKLEAMNGTMNTLVSRFDGMNSNLATMQAIQETLRSEMTSVRKMLEDHEKRLIEKTQHLATIEERLQGMNKWQTSIDGALDKTHKKIDDQDRLLTRIVAFGTVGFLVLQILIQVWLVPFLDHIVVK